MIYDFFRVTGAYDTVLDYSDFFSITLRNDDVQEFDTRCDEIQLSMTKFPPDDVLERLYKFRIRESVQLKTVLELYDMEIHPKISMPNSQKLKTTVTRSIDQKLRLRNFDARNVKIETRAVVTSRRGISGVARGKGICYQWKAKGQCSSGDKCSFRHDGDERAKPTQKPFHPLSHQHKEVEVRREEGASEAGGPSGKTNRQPCKNFLYLHQNYLVTVGIVPNVNSASLNRVVNTAISARLHTGRWRDNPAKRPKKDGDKSAAILKETRLLGCVFQDTEPPESSSILRKSPKVLGPIRRVRFTQATQRHANIRENRVRRSENFK